MEQMKNVNINKIDIPRGSKKRAARGESTEVFGGKIIGGSRGRRGRSIGREFAVVGLLARLSGWPSNGSRESSLRDN